MAQTMDALEQLKFDEQGLIPAIAQDHKTNEILMFAWMNRESLESSLEHKRAIYWSRSRKKLWMKGEQSQNYQLIEEIYLDCDSDVLLLIIKQEGGISCHTGRVSCFFKRINILTNEIEIKDKVIKDPNDMYEKKT